MLPVANKHTLVGNIHPLVVEPTRQLLEVDTPNLEDTLLLVAIPVVCHPILKVCF